MLSGVVAAAAPRLLVNVSVALVAPAATVWLAVVTPVGSAAAFT